MFFGFFLEGKQLSQGPRSNSGVKGCCGEGGKCRVVMRYSARSASGFV